MRYAERIPVAESRLPGGGECRACSSTAKQARGPFILYREAHGGLEQRGLSLSGVFWGTVRPTPGAIRSDTWSAPASNSTRRMRTLPCAAGPGTRAVPGEVCAHARAGRPSEGGRYHRHDRIAPALGARPVGDVVDGAAGRVVGPDRRRAAAGVNGNPWCNALAIGETGWVDNTARELGGSLAAPTVPALIPSPRAITLIGIPIGGGRSVSALDEKIGAGALSVDQPYRKQRYARDRRITVAQRACGTVGFRREGNDVLLLRRPTR